jgi:prophage regulatory protein
MFVEGIAMTHPVVLLRLPAVLKRGGFGRTTFLTGIRAGVFPPPVRFGRVSTWPEHEIDAILRARIAGAGDMEAKALVSDLLAKRRAGAAAAA